jgi:hypothetical protein
MGYGRSVRVLPVIPVLLVAILATAPLRSRAEETPPAHEALAEQLTAQLATNEALKQRIEQLEQMLKGDVCADPAAAEALLKLDATPAAAP